MSSEKDLKSSEGEVWEKKRIEGKPLIPIGFLLILAGVLSRLPSVWISGIVVLLSYSQYALYSTFRDKFGRLVAVQIGLLLVVSGLGYVKYHSDFRENNEREAANQARELIEKKASSVGTGELPKKPLDANEWQDPDIIAEQSISDLQLTSPLADRPIRFNILEKSKVLEIVKVTAFLRETFDANSKTHKVSPDQIDIEGLSFVIKPEQNTWGVYSVSGIVNVKAQDGVIHEVPFSSGSHLEYAGDDLEQLFLKSLPLTFRFGKYERQGDQIVLDGRYGSTRVAFASPLHITRAFTIAMKIKIVRGTEKGLHHVALDISTPEGNFVGMRGVKRSDIGGVSSSGRVMRLDMGEAIEKEIIVWITSDGKGEYSVEFPEKDCSVFRKSMPKGDWSRIIGLEIYGAVCTVSRVEIGTAEESKVGKQFALSSRSSDFLKLF